MLEDLKEEWYQVANDIYKEETVLPLLGVLPLVVNQVSKKHFLFQIARFVRLDLVDH